MTQKEWERSLLTYLRDLPRKERNAIIEYYREMYGDKLDAGMTNDEILREFGFPQDCADRILAESGKELKHENIKNKADKTEHKTNRNADALYSVGTAILSVLLVFPFCSAAVVLLISFAAVAISGIVVALAGIVVVIWSPFQLIGGLPIGGMIAYLGAGFLCSGIGILLSVGFFYLTKYTAKGCIKLLKILYRRNKP